MSKILDLYCGMGGLSLGFVLAGENISILGVDIYNRAVDTYNYNLRKYGAEAILADILSWQPTERYDIVIGGVPCQPYSSANPIIYGEKHRLYPTLLRFFDIILEVEPKLFLMENVKGLLFKKNVSYLQTQLQRVKDSYAVKWKVLDARKYGVPQRRERLIVVGVRNDLNSPWEFPSETHREAQYMRLNGDKIAPWITVIEAIGDILNQSDYEFFTQSLDTPFQRKHPPITLEKPSRTITANISKNTREALILLLSILFSPSSTILTDGMQRKLGHHNHPLSHQARKLTVRECLRIQSFPDWWAFPQHVKKTRQYKLIGEAVPPILAYRLARQVYKTLNITIKPLNPADWNLPYFERSFDEL